MIFFGVIFLLIGFGGCAYGIYMNNDIGRQMESLFGNGTTNPGSIFIVMGIGIAILGLIFLITGCIKNSKKK